ncbi:MAG: ABC transporter substrate-binding protein [Sphingosinicella sp.]|uniref:ABC transporter substrate-binding protein n=1 Tax=Sphingosinicella sp. TaxID=1917971 RepID=UPI004037A685
MAKLVSLLLLAVLATLSGCRDAATGPIAISAIGGPPRLVNPNLRPLEPSSALLIDAVAQGLVRFDSRGEIEPALAQSWIVSNDGLRYTFRLRRSDWAGGGRVTAEQVAARLRAALSRASRNRLKPVLAGIESIVAMTDDVLEISLRGPRPNLLQLLAQPEMGIILDGSGTGPFRVAGQSGDRLLLALPPGEEGEPPESPPILLRGERAPAAIARFTLGSAELVTGGTVGDLPFVRAADPPGNRLVVDQAHGLFGLSFASAEGPLASAVVRQALSMAIDRDALVRALNVPGFTARNALVPGGLAELPRPATPVWATQPLPMRRELAARTIAALTEPLRLRVAMPEGPGYRIVFAHLRRDWRLIGVEAERVALGAAAELRLIDAVAPSVLASWYLRHFTCDAARICDPAADQALLAARTARTLPERRVQLATADQILAAATPYIPLAAPIRWSLVSPRLTGFRSNAFARHAPSELIDEGF